MIDILMDPHQYQRLIIDVFQSVMADWDEVNGLRIERESNFNVLSPITYDPANRCIYVNASQTLREYALGEQQSKDAYVKASFNTILKTAKTGLPKTNVPEVFKDSLNLYCAFTVLHEIGHYVDQKTGGFEYLRLRNRYASECDSLPSEDVPYERASAYRRLPLERRADELAIGWLRSLAY